ncbi:MAG: TolC family protein, partial [Burkholderiaceae bacterium]|nr:TolC family protein [Burkholderiaceae bacterium]
MLETYARRRTLIALAALAAISGCALQSPPTAEELRQQALPHTALPAGWTADKPATAAAQAAADRWLASFGDPALSALVAEALTFNADLQSAAARVEQAGGYVKVAGASLLPKVGVYGLTGDKAGGSGALEGRFVNASLELDVWGRIRYGQAAAQAQSDAAQADFAYARQS